ncbi:hypothetical protein AX16_001738 [Volvariella volvacea WC 439]|nr:hypothetical protein AX16_001738 [Volvariella volvacea WC 439]
MEGSPSIKRVADGDLEGTQSDTKRARVASDSANSNLLSDPQSQSQARAPQQQDARMHGAESPSDAGDNAFEHDNAGEGTAIVGSRQQEQQHGKRDAAGWPKSRKGKAKSTRNVGRRRRGTKNSDAENEQGEQGTEEQSAEPKEPRRPKRMCALLIGFCGSGYSGMQIQPLAVKTIEGVLFQALVKIGAVSKDNADDPVKVSLGRAARTDAGVHAAGNVVSMKLIITIPGVPNIVERLNEELPPEIRVWGLVRSQNSFNARLQCDSRKYTYFFPTYLLLPPKANSGLDRVLRQYTSQSSSSTGTITASESAPPNPAPAEDVNPHLSSSTAAPPVVAPQFDKGGASVAGESTDPSQPDHAFWNIKDLTREDELQRKRAWRVPRETVEKLRRAVRKYEGTHNFHNFTVGRPYADRSNMRHMKKIEVSDPVVYGETEWISVMFHGQSFMLHQRKMMSGIVLSCRTGTPESIIDELYTPPMVFIPKMPSLGLLLEEPIFESYNSKVGTFNEKLQPTDPDYRPPIDFSIHAEKIQEFKQKFIYDNMRRVEDRNGLFDAWIRSVDNYQGNDFLYLNSEGKIPSAAIIKPGERRENPFRERKLFDSTSFTTGGDINTTNASTTQEPGQVQLDDEESESEQVMDKKELLEAEG